MSCGGIFLQTPYTKNPCENLRKCFTAGSGINITNGVISATATAPVVDVAYNDETNTLSVSVNGVSDSVVIPNDLDGLQSLNGLTGQTQTFATGTTGTDFNIVSSGTTHTFNIPNASTTARGLVNTTTQSFAGNKTFTNDVVIQGDLTVNGTNTILNTSVLEVEDVNVFINKGGNDTSAEGSGLTIDRTGTDGSLVYQNALVSKFKSGLLGSELPILVTTSITSTDGSVVITPNNTTGEVDLSVDIAQINEVRGYSSVSTGNNTTGNINLTPTGDDLRFIPVSLTGNVVVDIANGTTTGHRFTFNTDSLTLNGFSYTVEGVALLPNTFYEFVWNGVSWVQSK